jgi:hypothetical protein
MTAPKNADDGDNRSGEEIHARALDNVVRLDGGAVEVQNSVKRIQVENPGGNRIGEFKCKSREDHGQSGAETELPKNPKWAIDRLPTDGRLTREQVEGHHENQNHGQCQQKIREALEHHPQWPRDRWELIGFAGGNCHPRLQIPAGRTKWGGEAASR